MFNTIPKNTVTKKTTIFGLRRLKSYLWTTMNENV